jgi:hypothetical protein
MNFISVILGEQTHQSGVHAHGKTDNTVQSRRGLLSRFIEAVRGYELMRDDTAELGK